MGDLWSHDSLRGKYIALKRSAQDSATIFHWLWFLGLICISIITIIRLGSNISDIEKGILVFAVSILFTKNLMTVCDLIMGTSVQLKSFICPNCLKSIQSYKLQFTCPFCNETHQGREHVLFGKCSCNSYIQYVSCYHCKNPINLFAPYNQKELERKRYDRET